MVLIEITDSKFQIFSKTYTTNRDWETLSSQKKNCRDKNVTGFIILRANILQAVITNWHKLYENKVIFFFWKYKIRKISFFEHKIPKE